MTNSRTLLAALVAALMSGAAVAMEPPSAEAGIERLPPGAEMPAPAAAHQADPEASEDDAGAAEARATAAAIEEKRKQEGDEQEAGERQASPSAPAPGDDSGEGGRI